MAKLKRVETKLASRLENDKGAIMTNFQSVEKEEDDL